MRLLDQGVSDTVTSTRAVGSGPVRVEVVYDLELPDTPGEYSLAFVVGSMYSYTEIIEVEAGYESFSDHFSIGASLAVPVDAALGSNPGWTLYKGNTELGGGTATGVSVSLNLDTLKLAVSLDPAILVMANSSGDYTDHRVWRINPTILLAMNDLRTYLDRLNVEKRIDNLRFTDADYLLMLLHGRDRFNSIPTPTNFSMINASGVIRNLWLDAARIVALRTRYLEEGLSNYSYSGAGVTLETDVTQYLEQLASTLEQRLQDEGQRVKTYLNSRGAVNGSGQFPTRNRNIGVIGVTLGPLTASRRQLYGRRW